MREPSEHHQIRGINWSAILAYTLLPLTAVAMWSLIFRVFAVLLR